MTREDIIERMGWMPVSNYEPVSTYEMSEMLDRIERIVAAAVEAEREACAKIADSQIKNTAILTVSPGKSAAAWDIANAIRARGCQK
jgi:hypothetical protein